MLPLLLVQPGLQVLRDARPQLVDLPQHRAQELQVSGQSSSVVFLASGPRLVARRQAEQVSSDVHRAAESRRHSEPAAEPSHLHLEPIEVGLVGAR